MGEVLFNKLADPKSKESLMVVGNSNFHYGEESL